jgi:two-component system chemotaxis response regulator CheV
MKSSVEGMASLRGTLVPVIDLAKYVGIATCHRPEILIVTEFNGHTQGFLAEGVDTILRLDWSMLQVPPEMITNRMGGLVTAVTELVDGTLVMMLDVEKVLAETTLTDGAFPLLYIKTVDETRTVFFADDSVVARKQIERTLDAMRVKSISVVNGKKAWEDLQRLSAQAESTGRALRDT